jgi:hypothetical protein
MSVSLKTGATGLLTQKELSVTRKVLSELITMLRLESAVTIRKMGIP